MNDLYISIGMNDTVVDDVVADNSGGLGTFGDYCAYTSNDCANGYFCDMYQGDPWCDDCPTNSVGCESVYTDGIGECKSVCFGMDDVVVDNSGTFGDYCDYTSNDCAFGYFCDMHAGYPECNYCPTDNEMLCEYVLTDGIDECKSVCFGKKFITR